MSDTLRTIHEQLIDLHSPITNDDQSISDYCSTCDGQYLLPCETYQLAVAALAILNGAPLNASRLPGCDHFRSVPDPVVSSIATRDRQP